ncbi:DUF7586 domain-containing protein [Nocardia seriolae]|uniref:DUF7586 domain-containing protein n=1 Tax=Nocardia seriolae TaxID=37332 RepID=UPI003B8A6F4A
MRTDYLPLDPRQPPCSHVPPTPKPDSHFFPEVPDRCCADSGRFQGELLIASRPTAGLELRWATYPFIRTPR